MKRFLSVLIASMFLASAAIAADDMKKGDVEKKAEGEAKGEKAKGEGKAKAEAKGEKSKGEKGEKTKGEKGEKTKGEKATDEKTK